MTDHIFTRDLGALCIRTFKTSGSPENLKRLTGGASMETWQFDFAGRPLILRRSFEAGETDVRVAGLSVADEASLIGHAAGHGVTVPKVHAQLQDSDGLGAGFVMDRIKGEALPHKLLRDETYAPALGTFVDDCARELAAIHAAPLPPGLNGLKTLPSEARVALLAQVYAEAGCVNPVFSYALKWLSENLPESHRSTLVHGDFRMGNLLLNQSGLAAVLDWELAHIGDPHYDLGYLCAPCWRFGHYDRPVGGVGQINSLISAYEDASGMTVDRDAVQFWMVFSSLWWAVTCLGMVGTWRRGEVRSLERAVIGTRVSENEIDLLLMLERAAGLDGAAEIEPPQDQPPEMTGETNASELATALAEWVQSDVIPGAEERALFQARVARNALGIVERKARLGPAAEAEAAARLHTLALNETELCEGLARGHITLSTKGVLDHLRRTALARVEIDQPRYAGLAAAKTRWLKP